MNLQGVTRLQKEYKQLSQSTSLSNFVAVPDAKNIFEWHYVIYGLTDCPYEGGFYHGKLLFPKEYPMKPPGIMMITPSGRFQTKTRICLSISDFHPETWNPVWKTETILTALVSFMNSDENSTGCLSASTSQRRQLAKASLKWNFDHDKQEGFVKRFKHAFDKMGISEDKVAQSEEAVQEEESKGNKRSFLLAVGIALVGSYFLAKRLSP